MNPASAFTVKEADALYYPYIRIRDEQWLRKTLLVFPHLSRMVTRDFLPEDSDFIIELSKQTSRDKPLLQNVTFGSTSSMVTGGTLQDKLSADLGRDPTFVSTYGRAAMQAYKDIGCRPFHMLPDAISTTLFTFLQQNGLAEDCGSGVYELHPKIGLVVMSAFAFACAEENGLHVVADATDFDSRWLNSCIGSEGVDHVYEALLHPNLLPPFREADHTALFEVIAYNHCDASKLTPKKLAELGEEREPLLKLKLELEKMALSIPPMRNDEKLQKELEAKAHEVLRKWQSDQLNMGSVARGIFGIARDEGFKEVSEASKKALERLIKMAQSTWRWDDFIASVAGGAGVVGGVASFAGESPWHVASSVLATVGGTAIGIVVNGVAKAHKKSKESPFRYLTILEDRGVAFTVGA